MTVSDEWMRHTIRTVLGREPSSRIELATDYANALRELERQTMDDYWGETFGGQS